MDNIRLDNVSLTVDGAPLLSSVTMTLEKNELVALVGPNGAGKTSLLQCALGIRKPTSGIAMISNSNASEISPIERAKKVSYLPQSRPLAWPIRVKDIVALGRYAYGAPLTDLKGEDAISVSQALKDCALEHLAERNADTLSGGELARVHCARAFAAQAPFLIADEPIASLDPKHQISTLLLIRNYVDKGAGAMIVLHDISHAARFCDRIVWMKDGKIIADGTPQATITAKRLEEVFEVEASVTTETGAVSVSIEGIAAR